jgi:hypothetical protein
MYHITNRSHSHKVELEDIHLQAKAPAIFATQPSENVSGNYTFIPTIVVVNAMRENGWAAVDVKEQRYRDAERKLIAKHMITFQRKELVAKLGEYASEVTILNSHDRTSAFRIGAAIFRFVCSNGLMVSDSTLQSVSIRHSGHEVEEVLQASHKIFSNIEGVTERISSMKARKLTVAEQITFAQGAIDLRWENQTQIKPDSLLKSFRYEDAGDDLWHVFNRVQERVVRGGFRYVDEKIRLRKVRSVTGLDASIRLNKALWAMADNYIMSGAV